MARKNLVNQDGELFGWYDTEKATRWEEGTRWNGSDQVSLVAGTREHEELILTAAGRWVVHHWSAWVGHPESFRIVTVEQAREWLIQCEYDDADVEAATGSPVPSEVALGRPEVGPQVKVRFPQELIDQVDALAGAAGVTRSAWIRAAVDEAVSR